MSYKILESRIEFVENQIQKVTVLVDLTSRNSSPLSDVRALYATNKPCGGYMWIEQNSILSKDLLQAVAAYGMETSDRDKLFPGWKKKISNQKLTQIA